MKQSTRIILYILAVAFVLSLPFYVPSGAMLGDERSLLMDALPMEDESESDEGAWLTNLLFPRAQAAEAQPALAPLPIDFAPGLAPNPALFKEDGYEDASISLKLETRDEEGVRWRIAWVTIQDPSQMRTATAGKLTSSKTALISSMAAKNNAVIAINTDYMSNDPVKTSYEYRMGEKVRNKPNRKKDLLMIDQNGDFKLFPKSNQEAIDAWLNEGHQIINAFTFGPALVIDGQLIQMESGYGYAGDGKNPRMAIGQLGKLSYVLVLAEGRTKDSEGATHQELADFMAVLGCQQAFNFDGGNSATMVYNGGYYQQKSKNNERTQSDMLYFATLVDPASWQ